MKHAAVASTALQGTPHAPVNGFIQATCVLTLGNDIEAQLASEGK
ncbi:hypothetical protein GmRootV118_03080 [Variovorax sp. V118]